MMIGCGYGHSLIKYWLSSVGVTKENHKKTSTLLVLWSFVLKTPAVALVILQLYTQCDP